MKKTIIIGGSPCSGKSSVSEILSDKYNYQLIKTDDYLGQHIGEASSHQPIMYKWQTNPWHELFSRPVDLQLKEEIGFYQEEWPLLIRDIKKAIKSERVLIEGCAFMPDLVESFEEDYELVYMVPTEAFQRKHYEKRTWALEMLKEAKDPKDAFNKWMLRDIAFGQVVKKRAEDKAFSVIVIDGKESIEQVVKRLEEVLGLK